MTILRALLLINRESRQGEANAQAARDALEALDVEVTLGQFEQPEDVPAEIEHHAPAVDVIVLGGGDGTLNLAAASVMRAGKAMGVLPLGTANDFARTLLIPTELEAACRNVVEGVTHSVDLGQCNDVYFVNVASIGLAVRACEYRSDAAKRWLGSLGYASNVFSAYRDTEPFYATVRFGDETHQLRSIQLAVGNGRYFGGGLAVANDAALDDGRLDLYSLKPQSLARLVGMLPALVRGPDKSVQGVQLFEGTTFEITTDRPMPVNTDGEILTETPASFRVLPGALQVKVPQAYVDRYGRNRDVA
ncbi:lipid kinase [Endozoicomonas sp. G2_2]|uniref:lipid kinase n=1 Tax=Gammaproteobacteria TaxID=1236 RepID=UPI000C4C7C12|nr:MULTISPECIES: lipid kinase [Gammaproteobacteria]MAS10429.1 lipid kinase [Salinisphaera sp.]MBO9470125.1 lipid kinase [Endozoicomonas sp. G2_2]|tara:strand:+ start:692 stop:1606 length:915 start_codon:yes stop_codon:yes gene_type:complete